jgi:hypothetical protein
MSEIDEGPAPAADGPAGAHPRPNGRPVGMTTREYILQTRDRPATALYIPEWDTTVYVRPLSARQRDRLEGQQARDPYTDVRARVAMMAVVEEDGRPMFDESDLSAVSERNSRALDRIWVLATALSGITKEDFEELKKGF